MGEICNPPDQSGGNSSGIQKGFFRSNLWKFPRSAVSDCTLLAVGCFAALSIASVASLAATSEATVKNAYGYSLVPKDE